MESSLCAFGTDCIPLYQLLWPGPTASSADTGDELAELLADSKIRHVGVSNFTAAPGGES